MADSAIDDVLSTYTDNQKDALYKLITAAAVGDIFRVNEDRDRLRTVYEEMSDDQMYVLNYLVGVVLLSTPEEKANILEFVKEATK